MIRAPEGKGFFHDDLTGSRSMARLLLWMTTLYIFAAIAVDTFTAFKVSAPAWVLLSTMEGAFTIWIVGPKTAAFISPLWQKGLDSLADVIKKRRDPDAGTEATP